MERRGKQPDPGVPPDDDEPWPGATSDDWDAVDEASWESFPASDAPSFTPGRIDREAEPEDEGGPPPDNRKERAI